MKFKKLLVLTLAMIMIFSQTVYAGWGNNNKNNKDDKKVPYGQMKKIEQYEEMDSNKIRVKNKHMKFDVPPVLKNNRTLIPVRAITEAFGCDVEWVEPKAYIISPDKDKIIVFDLETEKTYVAEGWSYEQLLALDNQVVWDSLEVTIDAPPGLVNNRTFVPLRFIAEELNLKVGYDKDTGVIDIDEEPSISPKTLTINDADLLPTTYKIEVDVNDFEFKGIEGLTIVDDYTLNADDDIILTETYLKGVTAVTSELVIVFAKDTVEVKETFILKLNYLTDLPVLTPDEVTFVEGETSDLSYVIDVKLYGFELVQISSASEILTLDTDYKLDGDKLTINEAFLEGLVVGETELSLLFIRNTELKTVAFTIKVEEAPELTPVIEPVTMVVDVEENLPVTKEIAITLNGYTLKEVTGLEVADYTFVDDTTFTLLSTYLEGLDVPKTVLGFVFEKENMDDITLEFVIELEYLYLEPVLTPESVTFALGETEGLQVLIDMKLYGFELSNVIDHNEFLTLDTDFEIDEVNSELVLEESYLSTLEEGVKTLVLMFTRDSEVVFINYEIIVTPEI